MSVDRAHARYGRARANLMVSDAAVRYSKLLAAQKGKLANQATQALQQCDALVEEEEASTHVPADWDLCM